MEFLDNWKRPKDTAIAAGSTLQPEELTSDLMMHPTEHIDLVQDAASDCSVVASLAAVVARFARGHVKVCFGPSELESILT